MGLDTFQYIAIDVGGVLICIACFWILFNCFQSILNVCGFICCCAFVDLLIIFFCVFKCLWTLWAQYYLCPTALKIMPKGVQIFGQRQLNAYPKAFNLNATLDSQLMEHFAEKAPAII